MRPRLHDDVADIRYISIHAPLTGCDASSSYVHETWFQISIHAPLTGCDQYNEPPTLSRLKISIHAPLTGCDSARRFHWHCCYNFNPRTPYGMRLRGLKDLGLVGSISIHAPLTGCDMIKSYGTCAFYISIHAPLTGCDKTLTLMHFLVMQFQSTHPLRDATSGWFGDLWHLRNFNPRTPYGMRRFRIHNFDNRSTYFNPRTPYGMRLYMWYIV